MVEDDVVIYAAGDDTGRVTIHRLASIGGATSGSPAVCLRAALRSIEPTGGAAVAQRLPLKPQLGGTAFRVVIRRLRRERGWSPEKPPSWPTY